MWVLVAHLIEHCGYDANQLWGKGPLILLRSGSLAVNVFIVISGFVITHLLIVRHEPYRVYITKRFFRIFPVFLVCIIAAFFVQGMFFYTLDWLSEGSAKERLSAVAESTEKNIGWQLGAKATLLFGAIPRHVLPHAEYSFLPPAWSVSLEWQFYLIAPLLLFALCSRWWIKAVLVLVLFSLFQFTPKLFSSAFFFVKGYWFIVGILTYLSCRANSGIWRECRSYGMPILLLIAMFVGGEAWRGPWIALCIWLALVWVMLGDGADEANRSSGLGIVSGCLRSRPFLFLGQISYPLYLSHWVVLIVVQYLVVLVWPDISAKHCLIVLFVFIPPISIGVAWFLHIVIERPGQNLGKRIARGMNERRAFD